MKIGNGTRFTSDGKDEVSAPVLIVCGFVGGILITIFLFCLMFFKLKLHRIVQAKPSPSTSAEPNEKEETHQPKRSICYTRSNVSELQVDIGKWRAGYGCRGGAVKDTDAATSISDDMSDQLTNALPIAGSTILLSPVKGNVPNKSAALIQTGNIAETETEQLNKAGAQSTRNNDTNKDQITASRSVSTSKRNLFASAFHSIKNNITSKKVKKESDDSAYTFMKSLSVGNNLSEFNEQNKIQTLPGNFRIRSENSNLKVKMRRDEAPTNSSAYVPLSQQSSLSSCTRSTLSMENSQSQEYEDTKQVNLGNCRDFYSADEDIKRSENKENEGIDIYTERICPARHSMSILETSNWNHNTIYTDEVGYLQRRMAVPSSDNPEVNQTAKYYEIDETGRQREERTLHEKDNDADSVVYGEIIGTFTDDQLTTFKEKYDNGVVYSTVTKPNA